MVLNTHLTSVLDGTIESLKSVIPIQLNIDTPYIPQQPIVKTSMSVHIAMNGTLSGQIAGSFINIRTVYDCSAFTETVCLEKST